MSIILTPRDTFIKIPITNRYPSSITFQFFINILRYLLQTTFKYIFRISNKRNMSNINRTKRSILNKPRLLHTSNRIHIKLKPMPKIRSLTQIQSGSQIASLPQTLRPLLNTIFNSIGLCPHGLRIPALRILVGLPDDEALQLVSLALFHILCQDILRFFLYYWQVYVESAGLVLDLLFFSFLFYCLHYLLYLF